MGLRFIKESDYKKEIENKKTLKGKIYFQAEVKKSGYALQLVVDFDKNIIDYGYFLFNSVLTEYVKLKTERELKDIRNALVLIGFTIKEG